MTESVDIRRLYLEGIAKFNACEFFDAHEIWEDLWATYGGSDRTFYQGLIQVAVALHHFGNGNIRGAKKLYHSSRNYLEPFRPAHQGCNIEHLFIEMEECFHKVLCSEEEFPQIAIDPELIPEIHLDVEMTRNEEATENG